MKILLVEDSKKFADSLARSLESEKYLVDLACDGQEGFDMASVGDYDLIILDVNLPSMDGFEITEALRKNGNAALILMLTARDLSNDKVKGLNCGADDYLVKPFVFPELLARIKALIRRTNQKMEPVYAVGTLELNPVTHIVKRCGKEIELTSKEYSLLEFLMVHVDQIVTRNQILDHVWDTEVDPFSNIIGVYIGYLRNKVDRAFPKEKPLIHTVKGIGFRLGQK